MKIGILIEIGAGTVVPSIRCSAEAYAIEGKGLIRVNPSQEESLTSESGCASRLQDKYCPIVARSDVALHALLDELARDENEHGLGLEEKAAKRGRVEESPPLADNTAAL